ncbi:glycosyltransferase [Aliiroseovarius sp. KMU-50]|uniref:Glycosyltransferase n=1 Tax=Aliiroseovarius salicola TaxID=3009082 RepID=A0ABT4W4D4_9RHOB|nr:glycosyltransferase [Aliiroseovarius sp. KMU-50]MDA5095385.1 glycosyltransferase [Aliiroseovarius sp. KMU-50]
MTKISIIVTAYNIEKYIRQSLDCVLSQTLRDIEIIVVDDGSSDATPRIIEEYAQRDSRIRPILFDKNTIGGVGSAANAGLEIARGEYVGFADGDDLYGPTMFEVLYEAAVATSSDLAMCRYEHIDDGTGATELPSDDRNWRKYSKITSFNLNESKRKELLRFNAVPWRKIYKRDLIERVNLRFPVGDHFYEDNPFHWAAILGCGRVVMVPELLCQYRVCRSGQTMTVLDARMLKIFDHHDNILGWLKWYGVEKAYEVDLLHWTAKQLSWVSLKAGGDIRRQVFDILQPIVTKYDVDTIVRFGKSYGMGRSYQMIQAIREDNFDIYEMFATFNGRMFGTKISIGKLLKCGQFYLRHTGFTQTGRLALRYFGKKIESLPILRRR